jgi:hypothetical protein
LRPLLVSFAALLPLILPSLPSPPIFHLIPQSPRFALPPSRLHCAPCSHPSTNQQNGRWSYLRLPCEHINNNTLAAAAAAAKRLAAAAPEAILAQQRAEAAARESGINSRAKKPVADKRFCEVAVDEHFM